MENPVKIRVEKITQCHKCKTVLTRFGEFDAWACMSCNEWREEKCWDNECCYCKDRPETPNERGKND